MRRTALCGGIAVALLAGLVTGCGQSSLHSGGDEETTAPTSTASAPRPSPTVALTEKIGERLRGKNSVRFTATLGRATVRGAASLTQPVAVRSALDGPAGPAGETIRVAGSTYLTSPRIVADGIGSPWATVAPGQPVPFDSPGGLLRRSPSAVPTAVLDELRAAGTLVGPPENTDGQQPYTFRIDPSRIPDSPLGALAGRNGITDVRAELWLDADGLPKRVRTTVPLPDRELVTEIRYGAWDAPVDIAAPAPDRVGPAGA